MNEYPKEDKCRICGVHLGWMLSPVGEAFGLGLCEKPTCQEIDRAKSKTNGNGQVQNPKAKA